MNDEMKDLRTVVPCSMRLYSEDRDMFKKIKEETGLQTDAQVFAQLVQSFYDPIRVKDETEQLRQQAAETESRLQLQQERHEQERGEMTAEIDRLKAALEETQQRLTGAENRSAEEANRLQLEYEAKSAEMEQRHALHENEYRMTITPDNYRVLQLVAARESQRRGQAWTPSHIVNFFVYSRFIKGSLNGDLKSLSDSELRQAGINLKPEKKEADL